MAQCQRCNTNQARSGFIFCGPCKVVIQQAAETAQPSGLATVEHYEATSGRRRMSSRSEFAHGITGNGLTYASMNGREVCPDILITHGSVDPAEAARTLGWLRAQTQKPITAHPDMEWDPVGPEEAMDE